jgi:hypothetical protein
MSIRVKRLKPKDHAIEPYSVPISGAFEIRSIAEYRLGGVFFALIEERYSGTLDPNIVLRQFATHFMPRSHWCLIMMDAFEGIGNRRVSLTPESLEDSVVLSAWVIKPDYREVAQIIRAWLNG